MYSGFIAVDCCQLLFLNALWRPARPCRSSAALRQLGPMRNLLLSSTKRGEHVFAATRSFHDGESVGCEEGTPRGTATGDDMPQVSPLMGLGTNAAYNNSARSVPVTVTSLGSGMFALAATPDKAGTYVMRVRTPLFFASLYFLPRLFFA